MRNLARSDGVPHKVWPRCWRVEDDCGPTEEIDSIWGSNLDRIEFLTEIFRPEEYLELPGDRLSGREIVLPRLKRNDRRAILRRPNRPLWHCNDKVAAPTEL